MSGFPETQSSLLVRVQSLDDPEAWHEFAAIYRPVVYRLARKRGLQHADAEDLVQRVFIAVARAIGNWEADPSRGRFRSWLTTIARNAIINALVRRPPDAGAGGTDAYAILEIQSAPDRQTQTDLRAEYRRSLFRWAAERIHGEFHEATWQAFWLTAVEGRGVEETAAVLGKSVGSVYAARSRIMRRLRTVVEEAVEG